MTLKTPKKRDEFENAGDIGPVQRAMARGLHDFGLLLKWPQVSLPQFRPIRARGIFGLDGRLFHRFFNRTTDELRGSIGFGRSGSTVFSCRHDRDVRVGQEMTPPCRGCSTDVPIRCRSITVSNPVFDSHGRFRKKLQGTGLPCRIMADGTVNRCGTRTEHVTFMTARSFNPAQASRIRWPCSRRPGCRPRPAPDSFRRSTSTTGRPARDRRSPAPAAPANARPVDGIRPW